MSAIDAYHRKVTLAEDLGGYIYPQMMEHRVASVRGDDRPRYRMDPDHPVPSVGVYDREDTGAIVLERMRRAVELGYTFHVTPHMQQLVTAAAESLPDVIEVAPDDLPTEQGFLWIPDGMMVIDVRGRVLKYNAALWSAYGGQVMVWWLTDKYDEDDATNAILKRDLPERDWRVYPQLTPNGESRLRFGENIPMSLGMNRVMPPDASANFFWDESTGLMLAPGVGYEMEDYVGSVEPRPDSVTRWLYACWRLMQQPIVTLDQEPVPRQLRKVARRAGLSGEHVTVVDLRRTATRSIGEGAVEWSHRWLVRGHWRKQPYKIEGTWVRKPIFIHPHVKGPEGLPLVIRDHVYNLRR